MATSRGLFGTSLARKYWMALTGLFLCSFLVIHLLGNLPLLTGNQEAFNAYAHFMTTFPLIKAVSYLLYGSILLHSIDGMVLAYQNKKARPQGYKAYNGAANANWSSRNMALLGILTLLFILVHMKSFWFEMHFGPWEDRMDAAGNKDLYTLTVGAFESLWYSLFYVLCMLGLGFHLWHGFASAFQTMGWSHPRYTPLIKALGYGFAVLVPATFASIPLYILLN
ncbi:MAG: succinate dehydrogenase [Flavobacteriia bacterium]|jgi:succinate dehydrogenase / fumarate reductase cytochrome b subunit|nr:succinate dehydrogenase [Flavobacteriia bacterium]NDD47150.1 succinate dehydrogenase [Flavobacteriia bacterium]NDD50511.1 succinate dehydrogenase [Flavobacteriia bacterium]